MDRAADRALDSRKLVVLHDVLNERIQRVAEEQRKIPHIKGPEGPPGRDGKDGKDGRDGKDGQKGEKGDKGDPGEPGVDGEDGVSVVDAKVDIDGHLTLTLSDGSEIDAGEVKTLLRPEVSTKVMVMGSSSSSDLNLSTNALTATFVAGEALSSGDCCHLNSSGEMIKADATDYTKSFSMLTLCTADMAVSESGTFLIKGVFPVSGFSPGDTLFLAITAGELSATSPNGSGNINRVAGYATSSTQIFFDPDKTWMEIN